MEGVEYINTVLTSYLPPAVQQIFSGLPLPQLNVVLTVVTVLVLVLAVALTSGSKEQPLDDSTLNELLEEEPESPRKQKNKVIAHEPFDKKKTRSKKVKRSEGQPAEERKQRPAQTSPTSQQVEDDEDFVPVEGRKKPKAD